MVGIDKPDGSGELFITTTLDTESISTSGTARKFFVDENGIKRSHIIDPKNGYSVINNLLSVTIKHNEAVIADGLATALMVMGLNQARQFAMKHKYKALLIYDEDGKMKYWSSPNFFNSDERNSTLQ